MIAALMKLWCGMKNKNCFLEGRFICWWQCNEEFVIKMLSALAEFKAFEKIIKNLEKIGIFYTLCFLFILCY